MRVYGDALGTPSPTVPVRLGRLSWKGGRQFSRTTNESVRILASLLIKQTWSR